MYNQIDAVSQDRKAFLAQTFPVLMRKVYSWMALGLLMTALTSLIVVSTPSLLYAIFSAPYLLIGLLVVEVAMVLILSAMINKLSFAIAGVMFAAYAILNGVTLSCLFLVYTEGSIVDTFLITAATFGGMSLLGYVTKKDLSVMGQILYMSLIGLVLATTVNVFMGFELVYAITNYAGVLIFVGLTAYDTQKIKKMLQRHGKEGVNDQTNKLALMGSLELYLDFVNLFLYLLRFMGKKK